MKTVMLALGSVYVETVYTGLMTGKDDAVKTGKEYRADRYEIRLGGSAVNFCLQAKKLGVEVGLVGKTGQDEMGEKLKSLLKEAGIATELIVSSTDVQTGVDTGIVLEHSGENIQIVAGQANQRLSLSDIKPDDPLFDQVTAVYLGGYMKQESLYQDYPTLLRKLRQRGIRIFLDHGRVPVDVTQGKLDKLIQSLPYVDGYLPNSEELLGVTGEVEVTKALAKALEMGPKFIAVKLGRDGCRVMDAEEDQQFLGYPIKAVDTVGAGDTFNAAFVVKCLEGKKLKECGEFANAAGAFKVSQGKIPTQQEVENFHKSKKSISTVNVVGETGAID